MNYNQLSTLKLRLEAEVKEYEAKKQEFVTNYVAPRVAKHSSLVKQLQVKNKLMENFETKHSSLELKAKHLVNIKNIQKWALTDTTENWSKIIIDALKLKTKDNWKLETFNFEVKTKTTDSLITTVAHYATIVCINANSNFLNIKKLETTLENSYIQNSQKVFAANVYGLMVINKCYGKNGVLDSNLTLNPELLQPTNINPTVNTSIIQNTVNNTLMQEINFRCEYLTQKYNIFGKTEVLAQTSYEQIQSKAVFSNK